MNIKNIGIAIVTAIVMIIIVTASWIYAYKFAGYLHQQQHAGKIESNAIVINLVDSKTDKINYPLKIREYKYNGLGQYVPKDTQYYLLYEDGHMDPIK